MHAPISIAAAISPPSTRKAVHHDGRKVLTGDVAALATTHTANQAAANRKIASWRLGIDALGLRGLG
jgi:hypothetical protein